jgi:phage gp29-like protein
MAGSLTGGLTGAYAGAKGQRSLVNAVKKLGDPATIKRLSKYAAGKGVKKGVKSTLMKALAKLGVSAAGYLGPQAIEPISTVAGIAGTAWAAHDIYQIAKEVPELMDIIFTEE